MILIKTGEGIAKHPANLGKIYFCVLVKSYETKEHLLSNFCAAYQDIESDIYEILTKYNYNNKISFNDYTSSAEYKKIETVIDGKTTYETELDYYYIVGHYSLDLEFENRKVFAELLNLFNKANTHSNLEEYSIYIDFTLTEETFAKMRALATNNALDNIAIEVNDIAVHMGLVKATLMLVDFNFNRNNSVMYDNAYGAKMNKMSLSEEETIKALDDMLSNEKDIEVISRFESKWELE